MKKLELKENLEKFTCVDSCPIRNVISRFSGKWSMLVLCVLSENEATLFNAIENYGNMKNRECREKPSF